MFNFLTEVEHFFCPKRELLFYFISELSALWYSVHLRNLQDFVNVGNQHFTYLIFNKKHRCTIKPTIPFYFATDIK